MATKKKEVTVELDFSLTPTAGANKRKKRLGCGNGSGHGKTCGKGHKGQRSRSGQKRPYVGFEGGQMPLARRLPKRGFNNAKFALITKSITIDDLNIFNDGDTVNLEALKKNKIVRSVVERVKIISGGELAKKLKIEVYNVSESAMNTLKKAGCEINISKKEVQKDKKKNKKSKKKEE